MGEDDEALACLAREGDDGALRLLLERYRPPLEALLLRSIPPALRAKVSISDVLQETYAAVWQDLETFQEKGPGSFRAWLLRVANHRMVDAVRRFRTARRGVEREVTPADHSGADVLPGRTPTPSSLAIAEELENRLRSSLSTLAPAQREVLQLVLLEGLSMAEVGRRMGRSANAAQKLFARAKDVLWRLCVSEQA